MANKLIVLVLLVFVNGCSAFGQSNAFGTGACTLPCYQSLTPGQSTGQDLDRIIATLTPKEKEGLRERHYDPLCRSVHLRDDNWDGEVWVQYGQVLAIQLAPRFNLTLRQVIERFGPPESLDTQLAVGPDGSLYLANAFYPAKGLSVELRPNPNEVGQIKPEARVIGMNLSRPGDLQGMLWLPNTCRRPGDDQTVTQVVSQKMAFLRPWTGFGTVEVRTSR